MKPKPTFVAFILAVTGLVVAIVFFEHASPDHAQNRDFVALLAARRSLDQTVVQHALEARFALAANYDQLASDDLNLRRLQLEGSAFLPKFLRGAERLGIERDLDRYGALADRRRLLLERFKSKNALLRNSISYFPSLAADLVRRARDPALVARVNDLRAQTLNLALQTNRGVSDSQRDSVRAVATLMAASADASERRGLELMLSHARVIASEKEQTDGLLQQILALPIDEARKEVSACYQDAYLRATSRASKFGSFVSALSVLLLVLVAYAGLRLRRAAAELGRYNERLETAVSERTAELNQEMARRAQMEIELRQAQKLESVGQLASGIAHEINTPIQYVGDSIHFLRDAFADFTRVLDAYRAGLAGAEANGVVLLPFEAAREVEEELDLPAMKSEVAQAFELTLDGTKQVAHIVSAMKSFAHTSVDKAPTDLNAAIENTLIVARNEYKYVAELELELGELPEVTCNAGGIRQVVLNLLVNAAHAISDVVDKSGERGLIRIRTEVQGSDVVVSITDSGGGIPEAVAPRIFDPFFTTKPLGKGSGQGLAISRSIIEQHAGKLWFETTAKGTTFFIRLPLETEERDPFTPAERDGLEPSAPNGATAPGPL
jgi:signal transduction histidine kinase